MRLIAWKPVAISPIPRPARCKPAAVLATTNESGAAQPMIWTTEKGKGRVFVSLLGHFNWTFDDPLFRVLLLRGISWSAKEPVDRFENIVSMGARVSK